MAGFVKIIDERFANGLSIIHPMGSYLNALHHTGYYYTFIGIAQIAAAIFLLIPRFVFLGALLYFHIILNILILSYAVRFEGSLDTSPLMLLANIYPPATQSLLTLSWLHSPKNEKRLEGS